MADRNGGAKWDPLSALRWLLLVVLVLFIVWLVTGGPERSKFSKPFIEEPAPVSSGTQYGDLAKPSSGSFFAKFFSMPKFPTAPSTVDINSSGQRGSVSRYLGISESTDIAQKNSNESQYKEMISLSPGTASSQIQPNQEYIYISAKSGNKMSINISGWTLRNGRAEKYFSVYGREVPGQSISVKIPDSGAYIFNPYESSKNVYTGIILKPGDRAAVITGQTPTVNIGNISTSFKLNRCTGYLQDGSSYRFPLSFRYNCPASRDVPGTESLSDTCYNFVRSIAGCHAPKLEYVKDKGDCLDKRCELTRECQNFVLTHFNFQGCFNLYSQTDGFVGKEWRVFLGRGWELWDRTREGIYLYDRQGKLVASYSYGY